MRKVLVLGAGIPQIIIELPVLIVFGVIMTAIAVPVFKRSIADDYFGDYNVSK